MNTEPTLSVAAAFDATGTLWVATVTDGHVELRRSADAGKTFASPVTVNPAAESILARGESGPGIAFGPAAQVYVSWAARQPNVDRIDVRFARSLDGGKTFSAPITVNRDHAPVLHYFPQVMVDGAGHVALVWIDSRDAVAAKTARQPYRGFAVYSAWSGDDGATFSVGRKLVDHSCECCRLALARAPDGTIEALFRMVYPSDVRDHALTRLMPDAAADIARVTFSGWSINACPEHGPALAIGADGTRHAVWYEAAHGPAIHYGQLRPNQPPRHALQVAGAGASHATLAVTGKTVRIVWNQVDAAGWTLQTRASTDNGAHFSSPHGVATSTAAVAEPVLITHDGHVYAIWNTVSGPRVVALGDNA